MFSEEVTTKSGQVKVVRADNEAELAEAVKVAKGEQAPVAPDINNPEHGNVVVSEFVVEEPKAEKPAKKEAKAVAEKPKEVEAKLKEEGSKANETSQKKRSARQTKRVLVR